MKGNYSLQKMYEHLRKTFAITGSEVVECCKQSTERIEEYRNYIEYLNSNIQFCREKLDPSSEAFGEQVVAINKLVEERNQYFKEYKKLVHEYRDILAFLELRVKGEKNRQIAALSNGQEFAYNVAGELLGYANVDFSPYLSNRENAKPGSTDVKKFKRVLNASKDVINYEVLKNTYEKGLADVNHIQDTISKFINMLEETQKHYDPSNEEHIKSYLINLDSIFKTLAEEAKQKFDAFAYYVSELKQLLAKYRTDINDNIDNIYREYAKVNREYKELRRKNIGKAVPANEVNDILERKKRLEEDLSGWKLHSQIIENFINEVNICEYNDCVEVENDLSK